MEVIHETAIELHRELRRRGMDLNSRIGRDAALHATLASKLGLPADGFSKALENSARPAKDYLCALMEVAQPFALMFHQIWTYLAKHCAPKANESLFVRFGFEANQTEIDWDRFRRMAESCRQVWATGPIVVWPLDDLWTLIRILSFHRQGWRSVSRGYEMGKPFDLPKIQALGSYDKVAHRVREAIQSWIDAIHLAWPLESHGVRNLPELAVVRDHNAESEFERELSSISRTLHDLVPSWSAICYNWALIPEERKREATDYFDRKIAPNLTIKSGVARRSALEALDILDLPFWQHRWHTYEVWAAIKALEALDEFQPVPQISGGHIELDGTSSAMVAELAASQRVFAHVQAETKLLHPIGRRKGIKPDLRFSIDAPPTNRGTIAIVEFKHRRALDIAHVSEVLAAYSLGVGLRGGVVLINYDAAPAVEVPLGCMLLGDVHPGRLDKVLEFQAAVRNCFTNASVIPQPRRRFVLLDVSESMSSEYTSQEAQRGLKHLADLLRVKVFRFNNGLVPGGDWRGDSQIATGGGTQLGKALEQLFALPEGGIPERLLVVTDGHHDHPTDLQKRCSAYVECKPNELEMQLNWLTEV